MRTLHRQAPALIYVAIRDRVLHPRAMLLVVASLFGVTAYETKSYPPDWLTYADLWAVVAAITSVAAIVATFSPTRVAVVVAGAFGTVAAGSRSFAIMRELVTDPPAGPATASFAIATVSWAAIAILIWQAFVAVVVPWSTRHRFR